MSWLIVTISAYFLFAVVALVDKYLLGGLIPSPKIYTFYQGVLGILVLFLIPFGFLTIPGLSLILLALISGAFRIFALFIFLTALKNFETSRVVPAIGGILPLSTFLLTYLFTGGKEVLTLGESGAFGLLILGSVIISLEREKIISFESLKLSALAAFLFALSFVFAKFVYLALPFWSGFIWIMIGSFLCALFFLFSKEVKEEIFKERETLKRKTAAIFLSNQAMGASAFILQNWAIALVPLGLLAFINALEGIRYIFLLIFTIFLSLKFPQILKEEITRKILFQKIIAILLIGAGLTILSLSN